MPSVACPRRPPELWLVPSETRPGARGAEEGWPGDREPSMAERHIIIEQNPDDENRSESVHRHEGGVDRPLLLDDAAVENDEAGYTLQTNECCGCQLPGVIACVEPLW